MEALPLTVCPSQMQLQSTDDQSLAAVEARLLQSFIDEGFLPDMNSLDPLPFPTTIPDPAPPSPSLIPEVPALWEEAPLDEDFFFADLEPLNYEADLPADISADLLASWDAAAAAAEHQPAPPTADADYEALFCGGAVPVPVAVGQPPATPESSTRRSSDDVRPAPSGWGWDAVSAPAPAPGYMTPPGSGTTSAMGMGMAMGMTMAMPMAVEEIDWEALLGPAVSAPAPPAFLPAPAPTSPPKTKTKAVRRERKITRRRHEATKAAPGTIVFAPNIVPPPEVYVSAYSHTREYCLDERGRLLKRRRYEDKVRA